MRVTSALTLGALAAGASAAGKNYLGFNSGSTLADRSAKFKSDFEAEFKTAQALQGAPGKFNAVRLYTNIQAYSQDDPIQAFDAAIETNTYMLLGIWASGTDNIDKEVSALKKAVSTYGTKFTDLVIGMSIGSEDLYRISVTGLKNDPKSVGNGPEALLGFISDFKTAFKDTPLSSVPIGHVDTWDSWTNSSNKALIDALDWVGVDEYPYYETGKGNDIKNSGQLFDRAYDATIAAVGGKPVWVTETGWPVTGPNWDEAVPSVENAKYYWDEVGCRKLFNKTPTFWYNLRDSNPDNKQKFGITNNLSTTPYFNLTCPTTFETPDQDSTTSASASASATKTGTATLSAPTASTTGSSSTGSGSGSNSGSGSGSGSDSGSSSGSATGSSPASTKTPAVAEPNSASAKQLSVVYAGLALVAGIFATL